MKKQLAKPAAKTIYAFIKLKTLLRLYAEKLFYEKHYFNFLHESFPRIKKKHFVLK